MQNNKNKETLEIYVLGDDFKYYENLKYLPLTSYPSNNQSALIVYSLRGTAKSVCTKTCIGYNLMS